jgi:hypothetical protein
LQIVFNPVNINLINQTFDTATIFTTTTLGLNRTGITGAFLGPIDMGAPLHGGELVGERFTLGTDIAIVCYIILKQLTRIIGSGEKGAGSVN